MRSLAVEVRRLAVPAILHSLLQTLVFVVDRLMLGRHGEASLAAMQIGGALEWSIWSVFSAFEVGTIARIGRHVGAGDRESARNALLVSLALAVGLGVFVAALTPGVLFALPYASEKVSVGALAEAKAYLGVTVAASPVVFVSATAVAALQASGDTRTPLMIGVAANIVHIGMNQVLIPMLGARGAGISTIVTFGISAVLALYVLSRKQLLHGGWSATEARALIRVGTPAFLERVLYHVGFILYAMTVTRLGDAAMAANQALISIESICFLTADGFAVASAALVAQKLGAEKPDEAVQAAWIATRYAVATLTVFGIGSYLLKDLILPTFSADPTVLAIGKRTIPVLVVAQPFMAVSIVLAQSMRGASRTKEALGITSICVLFVRLTATWGFALGLGLGLPGVWMGSTTDWIVRSIAFSLRFR